MKSNETYFKTYCQSVPLDVQFKLRETLDDLGLVHHSAHHYSYKYPNKVIVLPQCIHTYMHSLIEKCVLDDFATYKRKSDGVLLDTSEKALSYAKYLCRKEHIPFEPFILEI